MSIFGRRRREPRPEPPRWITVAYALHQPEAEMLTALLAQLGIPVLVQRATFDVPDMLAGGRRALMVPAERELEARALLDPSEPLAP